MFLIQKTDFNWFVSIKVQSCLYWHMPVWLLFMFWQTPREHTILVIGLTNTLMEVFCWKLFITSVMLTIVEKACMIFTAWPDTLQLCHQTLVWETQDYRTSLWMRPNNEAVSHHNKIWQSVSHRKTAVRKLHLTHRVFTSRSNFSHN